MEIVLATRNKKKAEEMGRLLSSVGAVLKTLNDFPSCPEVDEDQTTFEGNAIKKASAIAQCTGMTAVADDSGLEVYALGGAPGVTSARYAGEGADDSARIGKLLREMAGLSDDRRGARFVCCIALASPDGRVETFSGTVEGRIGSGPRGANGFGYDPVFFPSGFDRTFAEMSPTEKDALSHRSTALRRLRDRLANLSGQGQGLL